MVNNQTYATQPIQPQPVTGRVVNNLTYPNNVQYNQQMMAAQAYQQQMQNRQIQNNGQPIVNNVQNQVQYQQPVVEGNQ